MQSTSLALPNFAINQSLPLRRFLKCLTIRKDAHLTCHPEQSRAASIVIPSEGRSP